MAHGYAEAKHLLNHYMKMAWTEAGLEWDRDNAAEVGDIIDSIQDGVEEQIKRYLDEKARQEGQGR